MKHILFCFLMLLVGSAMAQRELVTDSTWISNENGMFFENHIAVYSTGEQEGGYKRLLGDTSQVVDKFTGKFEQDAARFANDAKVIVEYPAKIRELIRQDADVVALTGLSPLKTLVSRYSAPFTDTTWAVRQNGVNLGVVFAVNGQGNLRYTLDTFPTKTALIFGDIIRLNNFKNTADDALFYRIGSNLFSTIDRSMILRVSGPGNTFRISVQPDAAIPLKVAPAAATKAAAPDIKSKKIRKNSKQ